MSTQSVSVLVNLENDIISGTVTLLAGVRLSDYLNSGIKFLTLTDVSVTRADGIRENIKEVHVNKESIKMMQTVRSDAAQGIGCSPGEKRYPFVQKNSVRARIHMADFEIDGNLHCKDQSAIPQLLEQESSFLPCTDVKIRDINSRNEWTTDFAAVNRKQVALLQTIRE